MQKLLRLTLLSNSLIVAVLTILLLSCSNMNQQSIEKIDGEWPEITNLQKPWTRWWWLGNAVDKENITYNLEQMAKAGIGGVEITPIYGVKGYEEAFIDYLSPEWMDMLNHTIDEAARLGMQVDMVLGTGWPFGGPQVEPENAATKFVVQKYDLKKGKALSDKIVIDNRKEIGLSKVLSVLAYDSDGEMIELTSYLNVDGELDYTSEEDLKLYVVFAGKTRQQVKRSAPGGKGYTLDHFSSFAFEDYVIPYNEVLGNANLRAIFNDSYEVYGANFTPKFFEQFQAIHGYDFKPYVQEFLEGNDEDLKSRLLTDFREVLNVLLQEEFAKSWNDWSHQQNYLTKYQAHGSPGNIIDIYATADIPECETFGSTKFDIPGLRRDSSDIRHVDPDPVMLKFASSATHISGKNLTSSESFTWLADHFKVSLSQAKPELEQLFLSGVNHIFFHGSTYSPKEAAWPGFKFYASVNFNYTNPIWKDAPAFFDYIARCQSILQAGEADNDVLVYWPYFDALATASPSKLMHQFGVHSIDEWLHPTDLYHLLIDLTENGYSYDLLTDKYLQKFSNDNGSLVSGDLKYKAIIIPDCERMPVETLEYLLKLKEEGANIIFHGVPETVPGLADLKAKEATIKSLAEKVTVLSNPIEKLKESGFEGEALSKFGLDYIKRKVGADTYYFVVNHSAEEVSEYIPINESGNEIVLFDAYNGSKGIAKTQDAGEKTAVLIQLKAGESIFIAVASQTLDLPDWNYQASTADAIALSKPWKVEFLEGGPSLPEAKTVSTLTGWETWNGETEHFSGTAKYTTTIAMDVLDADDYILDLGDVRESAAVFVNGEKAGTVWSIPFEISIGEYLKTGENKIEIEVTNLAANRIRAKELRGEEWKIFYEINMVDVGYEKFDATKWNPIPSGLISEVQLIPVKMID